jgi:hypothetical protein
MIIGIRRVCRASTNFARSFSGFPRSASVVRGGRERGREGGRVEWGKGGGRGTDGERRDAGDIIVLFFPRPGKKCNWLDRNLSPRVEEAMRMGDARG